MARSVTMQSIKEYDIIVVGSGASGVFMAYELTKLKTRAKVLIIEKGAELEKRVCPIKLGKTATCIKCDPCHIMNGFGGAGTLSDGNYNITTKFGGELHNYVGTEKAMELMEYVDSVLCEMAAQTRSSIRPGIQTSRELRCSTICICLMQRSGIWEPTAM